jgi:hypothetical protein
MAGLTDRMTEFLRSKSAYRPQEGGMNLQTASGGLKSNVK